VIGTDKEIQNGPIRSAVKMLHNPKKKGGGKQKRHGEAVDYGSNTVERLKKMPGRWGLRGQKKENPKVPSNSAPEDRILANQKGDALIHREIAISGVLCFSQKPHLNPGKMD